MIYVMMLVHTRQLFGLKCSVLSRNDSKNAYNKYQTIQFIDTERLHCLLEYDGCMSVRLVQFWRDARGNLLKNCLKIEYRS